MYYTSATTHIPSRVVCLQPPVLTPSTAWAAVQPSPDRTSVLLRSTHECLLLRLTSPTAVCGVQQADTRVVLPQPHRRLTASCWVSGGLAEVPEKSSSSSPRVHEREGPVSAVVAVGDDNAAVSVLRTASSGIASHAQATIFLHCENATLLTRSGRCSASAAHAVETILPCSYGTASADVHLICRRRGDDAMHRGPAAARVPCHSVWVASVAKEKAWVVPLPMPPEEEEEEDGSVDVGSNAVVAVPPRIRLFDVRPRLPPPSKSAGHTPAAATGTQVFAAATRRHVGLFTATTVESTVYFPLPRHVPLSSTSGGPWEVHSVVEAPPPLVSFAVGGTVGSSSSSSSYGYLVTASLVDRVLEGQTPRSEERQQWWMFYDARNASRPVWMAAAPRPSATMLHSDGDDATAATEWLCAATTETSGFGSSALRVCAAYQPSLPYRREQAAYELATAQVSASSSSPSCGSVHVLLDSTATTAAPTVTSRDAGDRVAAPITWCLDPPPSLAAVEAGQAYRVRALSYHDHVLSYLCSAVR